MNISGIYKIQSKVKPERIYIGSAVDFKTRKSAHLHDLRNNKHHSGRLQNHYNKYRENDLVFILIEPCLPIFLVTQEQHYIDKLNPFFNICKVAGNCTGRMVSEETREKISQSLMGNTPWNKGKEYSPELRSRFKGMGIGRTVSIATRQKQSESQKGKRLGIHLSEEHKKKLSEAHKGLPSSRKGQKHTDMAKLKMSLSLKGRVAWNRGLKYSRKIA